MEDNIAHPVVVALKAVNELAGTGVVQNHVLVAADRGQKRAGDRSAAAALLHAGRGKRRARLSAAAGNAKAVQQGTALTYGAKDGSVGVFCRRRRRKGHGLDDMLVVSEDVLAGAARHLPDAHSLRKVGLGFETAPGVTASSCVSLPQRISRHRAPHTLSLEALASRAPSGLSAKSRTQSSWP